MNHENIILIGMAATGKSTLGKRLARRLNWLKDPSLKLRKKW